MTWLNNLHFIRPEYLLALPPLAILFALSWRIGSNKAAWHKLIDAELMPFLFTETAAKQSKASFYVLGLAWLLASIALAGPSWQKLPSPVYEKDDVLVIILDNTPSMLAQDNKPSRATHAAREIDDILQSRHEGRTALITYSENAFVVSPLTRDTNTIALLAKSLSPEIMPAIGNRPLEAITLALGLVKHHSSAKLLWLTDEVPKAESDDIIDAINNSNTSLSIMGIGTTSGAPIPVPSGNGFVKDRHGSLVIPSLNRSELQRIASAVNGRYSDSQINDDDINYLLGDKVLNADEATQSSDVQFDQWRDESWLIAFILLIPAALAFRQGGLFTLLLLLTPLLHSPTAQANWFDDMWQTKDQQAQTAFEQGDTKTAADLFDNTQWRGASAYKNGDYETAIKHYENANSASDWYNLGNAYAKHNKLTEAIAAYDKALAQQANFEDATANKALVEQLLNQQQDQQNNEQQDGDQQDNKQQGSENEDQQNQQSGDQQSDQNKEGQEQDKDSEQQNQPPSESDTENSESDTAKADKSEDDAQTEQEKQAQADANEEENSEQEQQAAQAEEAGEDDNGEPRQALPSQLRNIEDDPGGLLKRKFADQASKRQRSSTGEQRW